MAARRPVHLLLNPASAGGRALRRWRRIAPDVRAALGPFELHLSRHPGDLADRAAGLAGEDATVIAAGGDGTSHEVVSGLLRPAGNAAPRAVLGWLPLGSGNDLARAAGVPRHIRPALRLLASAVPRPIDAGRLRCQDATGTPVEHVFGNSATFGLSAAVLRLVERYGKPLGGPLTYAAAAAAVLLREAPAELALAIEGEPPVSGRFLLASCTSGPTFGAGMRIAPGARIDDGRLDLVTVAAIARLRALALFPRVYRGGHLRHPAVRRRAVRAVAIITPGPSCFDLDGELRQGHPPFEIEVRAGALRALVGW